MTQTQPEPAPELDDDQRAYELLFGVQPEWHEAPNTDEAPDDDEALYRALFGA